MLNIFFYTVDTPGDKECEQVLKELENIDDDTDRYEIPFVKANDKKLAKLYGVASFPALVYFRHKHPVIYNGESNIASGFYNLISSWYPTLNTQNLIAGDLRNEEVVLEWLTGIEGLEVADEIEELNQQLLERLINEAGNVAVLYCM